MRPFDWLSALCISGAACVTALANEQRGTSSDPPARQRPPAPASAAPVSEPPVDPPPPAWAMKARSPAPPAAERVAPTSGARGLGGIIARSWRARRCAFVQRSRCVTSRSCACRSSGARPRCLLLLIAPPPRPSKRGAREAGLAAHTARGARPPRGGGRGAPSGGAPIGVCQHLLRLSGRARGRGGCAALRRELRAHRHGVTRVPRQALCAGQRAHGLWPDGELRQAGLLVRRDLPAHGAEHLLRSARPGALPERARRDGATDYAALPPWPWIRR